MSFAQTNNQDILQKDIQFWSSLLDGALKDYGNTRTTTDGDIEAKSLTMSRLAAIGLGLFLQYSELLGDLQPDPSKVDWEANRAIGDHIAKAWDEHMNKLNKWHKETLN